MARYFIIGLSLMWMTVFYQNCSPRSEATAQTSQKAPDKQISAVK